LVLVSVFCGRHGDRHQRDDEENKSKRHATAVECP